MGTMVLMRSVLAGLVFLLAVPAAHAAPKSHCKDSCSSSYALCMKRSNTKIARKSCKENRKVCKKGCKG